MLKKPDSCKGCSLYETPFGKVTGHCPPSGSGDSGVLIVAEAAGEQEELNGVGLIGAAGQYLFSQLKRAGIEREGFRLANVLECRPPKNKLLKQPYTEAAIAHCAPNLDNTIHQHVSFCSTVGKHAVILALGKYAAKRVMGWTDKHPIMHDDYYTYPHWSAKYGCWVICAPHPSHIMQGNHHLLPLILFCTQRALDIAQNGLTIEEPPYLLDPTPQEFNKWVEEFLEAYKKDPKNTYLSYDIETPYKVGKNEDEIGKEDSDDFTILRCSFCWKPGNAASVRWTPDYMAGIERLFTSGANGINWNGEIYDNVRIIRYISKFNLISLDGMLAWHVLHTSLPKSLGFVTPFYWTNCSMWKHLSDEKPAYYNAKDADTALRNWLGILPSLKEYKLYDVFERHVMKLNEVLRYMTNQGIPLDLEARKKAEVRLSTILDELKKEMSDVVPEKARTFKVYKKTPKDTTEMVQTMGDIKTTRCPTCGEIGVKAGHFKSLGNKRLKAGELEQPCAGGKADKVIQRVPLWAKPLEFKLSTVSLTKYQNVVGHKPIINRKENRPTFDEPAIKKLRQKYPQDKLYQTILSFRESQTLLSRYVGRTQEDETIKGGMFVGSDGRVHCLYTHNPSTLRLASQNPNMQNLPRPGKKGSLQSLIRNLITASPGWVLGARDFSGIEAVLVGYEARDKDYIRLATRDVHSFYTAYALYEIEGRIPANDLPLLSWDDEKLFSRLAEIKKEFKQDRNNLYKHLVHAINFGQGAYGARDKIYEETDIVYDPKLISKLMSIYHSLFPKIGQWQKDIRIQAADDGFVTNAFGYIHRFNHIFKWVNKNGEWEKELGDDAEAVLAFKPQSNAAGIIKEAMLRLYFNRFEEAGQYMRLTTHDEIMWECPPELLEQVDAVFVEEMEKPVPQLPLPDSYGMGPALQILTEGKSGFRWGEM